MKKKRSGQEVVGEIKKAASACVGKGGWDHLECLVDQMNKVEILDSESALKVALKLWEE